TGGGLSQVQGLSEGCGDYWAASYKRSLGLWDPSEDAYHHVFGWDGHNQFWPGRRVDLMGTYPTSLSGGIHNQGQFWSSSMMLIWDVLGQEKTDRIFWEGIAMTGSSASQNDAAVGVFLAANALGYSLADRQTVHTILTDRGYQLPAFNVLPVEWDFVTAIPRDKTILVQWGTVSETDNAFFELERFDPVSSSFTTLASMAPNQEGSYSLEDDFPFPGTNTYRIRQVDHDGTHSYSKIVSASLPHLAEEQWQLSPNPTNYEIFLRFNEQNKGPRVLRILDLQGREYLSTEISGAGATISVADLPPGVYLIQTKEGSRRFVKQ
ncbi:MAG: T9SS type A sorting domain-containing protein, partial [Bacteroidota bacterium]